MIIFLLLRPKPWANEFRICWEQYETNDEPESRLKIVILHVLWPASDRLSDEITCLKHNQTAPLAGGNWIAFKAPQAVDWNHKLKLPESYRSSIK